jgi:hypothetical protein
VPNIRSVENIGPDLYDRSLVGVIVKINTSGTLGVNVQGNVIPARWADPIVAAEGDTVLVQLIIGRTGQTEAFVKAKITKSPRPARGTVSSVPPSSDTVTVTGTDGGTYTAYFVTSYTPTVSDEVLLSWFGSKPTIVGKVAATAAPTPAPPPAPTAPPPPPPQVGTAHFAAASSNTYWPPGGWGSWASGRGRVFQGSYGAGQVYGAWFYHNSPGQLAGRAITRVLILLGGRLAVGSFNSPVTVHFYLTSNASQPGGNVTHIAGPHNVTAWPGQGMTHYDLPADWGDDIVAGSGIGIMLDPYAGFYGVNEQPESGKLTLDWRI